uniref:Transthyretin-like S-allantoin synthase protein n=1 Tax=Pelargonium exstipulatum TaxID=59873 RepID=A0A0G2T3E7_9ROSI|nr:transthyretin-like S-allantoin synthase protein [Pelargonium exstipulatum]
MGFDEKDFLACCGSSKFAMEMASASPFETLEDAITTARHIWFNKVDVHGWLEAFEAHPQIGKSPSPNHKSETSAQWSKGEQTTALATATGSSLLELSDWNAKYMQKFGFVFLICASGRSTSEILTELKKRYPNRPIVEFENAAQEQMKITELRLAKLFSTKAEAASTHDQQPMALKKKAEDRVSIIGAHLTAPLQEPADKTSQISSRTRPPITTHVLDVSRGSPAVGMDVKLEMWMNNQSRPSFDTTDLGGWVMQGFSMTDIDGRSGQLMNIVDSVNPGIYRISFNTGKYCPGGFFPYVSLVFEIRETQKSEHFHVPLLFSPFSFTTYRGS